MSISADDFLQAKLIEILTDPVVITEDVIAVDPALIAGSPSFDVSYPKIPGRNLEGVPNANDPVMREKLKKRLLNNPSGGEQLPGFLGRV